MKTELVLKGFEKTAATEQFLEENTWEALEPLLVKRRDVRFRVSVTEESHRNQVRKPHFACEIQIKTAGKQWLKVHKSSAQFHESVIEASRAMKRILSRLSDKRSQKKGSNRNRWIQHFEEAA